MERDPKVPLYKSFLSINAADNKEQLGFTSIVCEVTKLRESRRRFSQKFKDMRIRPPEQCVDCGLCDHEIFASEQGILKCLEDAFLKEKSFNIQHLHTLNDKLKMLLHPVLFWEYRDWNHLAEQARKKADEAEKTLLYFLNP